MNKKQRWTKTAPTTEGWFWCRYTNKHNQWINQPCQVCILDIATCVTTAGNASFIDRHDGRGMTWQGKPEPIFFGPEIIQPDLAPCRSQREVSENSVKHTTPIQRSNVQ